MARVQARGPKDIHEIQWNKTIRSRLGRTLNANTIMITRNMRNIRATITLLLCSVLLGPQPFYVISDMDLVKEITVKHFDKFVDRKVSSASVCTP